MAISKWDSGDTGNGVLGGNGLGKGGGGWGMGGGATDANAREFGTMLQVVSEGPILGLVNGLKSVYLDGTPVQNPDNSLNFHGVAFALVAGTNTQAMIPGISDVESETPVNVQVIYSSPVSRTISTAGISAIRVRVAIPALKHIDPTSGAESGALVQFKIEKQSPSWNGGAWATETLAGDGVVAGQFGGKYTKSFRIETPAAGPWTIKVSRITADHVTGSPDYTQDETWWDAYQEITDAKLRYPFSAVAAIKVDSKQFNQIPQLTMEGYGRVLDCVPSNYNPTTRAYTGIWDGTFQSAWTDNPAWIWYDLASHTRYGAGTVLDASKLDKWALYTIAQACDVLVSDGKGGTEPRFRCSVYLQSQEDAIKLLSDMASIFRGMAYWAGGLVTAVQDADASPEAIFTNSNVKDGRFTYQGSARKSRHTAALVSWQDPQNGYRTSVEYVEDRAAIARYGYNPTHVVALGATSQAQAHRLGLWTLLTETMDTEVVSFTSGLEGTTLRPGVIFAQRDEFRAGDGRQGGRIAAGATTTVIPLDSTITLPAGTNTLYVRMADGTVQSSTVTTAAGAVSSLTVSPAFTVAPVALSQWALNPALYRVLTVTKGDGIEYDVTALQHTPAKYALVDGVTVTPGPATADNLFQTPFALTLSDLVRTEKDKLVQTLKADWSGDVTAIYAADASQDYGPWQPMKVNGQSATLDGVTSGTWRVRVRAIYATGQSPWASGSWAVGTPTQTATDAAAAAAAAAAAHASANAALADISNITSDNVLSMGEKSAVIQDWSVLSSEQAGIDAQATAYGVSHTAYDSALSSLSSYLGGLTPAWNDTTQDTSIVGTTFRTNWENAYTAKTSLLNAIYAAAKALADAAQASANTALTQYSDASNDGIITDLERPGLKTLRATLALAVSAAQSQANGMGVGHSTLDTAWSTFTANVDPVLVATGNSAITKATWDGWWSTVYQEVQNLQGVLATTANNAAAYANTLARSSYNLIKNANSENPNATGNDAAGLVSGASIGLTPRSGSYLRYFDSGGGGLYFTDRIPCAAGEQFHFEGWIWNTSVVNAHVLPYILFFDASGTNISATSAEKILAGSAWVNCPVDATAPAGTATVQFHINAAAGNGGFAIDDLYACRKISAGMLEADIAILGVVRSPNWVAGAYGSAPVGFWLGGYARTTTYIDGTTSANCFFELQGDANFGGYRVSTVNNRTFTPFNRILNGTFYMDLANWSTSNAGFAWSSSSSTSGGGSALLFKPTGVTLPQGDRLIQGFSCPPTTASVALTLDTGFATDATGITEGGSVKAYLFNCQTGVETLLATWTYSSSTTVALAWTSRSVDITSYVSGGGDFVLRLAVTINSSNTADTVSIYVDNVKILI